MGAFFSSRGEMAVVKQATKRTRTAVPTAHATPPLVPAAADGAPADAVEAPAVNPIQVCSSRGIGPTSTTPATPEIRDATTTTRSPSWSRSPASNRRSDTKATREARITYICSDTGPSTSAA